jgi:hypothetical protein
MKTIPLFLFLLLLCGSGAPAQEAYKQNFLSYLAKIPQVTTVEAAYSFETCKSASCASYKESMAALGHAKKDLTMEQVRLNQASTPNPTAGMSKEELKAMRDELKKMSKEEKMAWAMKNAGALSAGANPHVNADGSGIMDACKILADQEERDIKGMSMANDCALHFGTLEAAYTPRKQALVKKFQEASQTEHNPLASSVYVMGEASEAQVARFDRALADFKKAIVPLLNKEMGEKLACITQKRETIIKNYTRVEEAIASTHFADDAKEPVNKQRLLQSHAGVLGNVMINLAGVEGICHDYAVVYGRIFNLPEVQRITIDAE